MVHSGFYIVWSSEDMTDYELSKTAPPLALSILLRTIHRMLLPQVFVYPPCNFLPALT